MKALHFDQVSQNTETLQKKNNQTIKGADIFGWNLLFALLEYGTYDAYFAQGLTEEKKQLLLEGGLTAGHIQRLIAVPFGKPLPVKESDQLVFLTAGRYLNALAAMRQKVKRYDAPVCGFIHSINSPRIALAMLQQCKCNPRRVNGMYEPAYRCVVPFHFLTHRCQCIQVSTCSQEDQLVRILDG